MKGEEKRVGTPYVGFGNDTLGKQPRLQEGTIIVCPRCHNEHTVECGTSNGVKSDLLMFYKCGGHLYLAAVAGKSVIGVKSDCSGEVQL